MAMVNERVLKALEAMKKDPDSVIEADLDIFCPEANEDKESVFKQLVSSFGNDPDHSHQKISLNKNFPISSSNFL